MKLSLKKCALALILANQLLVVPQALSQIGAQERQDLSPVTSLAQNKPVSRRVRVPTLVSPLVSKRIPIKTYQRLK